MRKAFGSNMPSKNSLVARVRRFFGADSEGGALVEMAISLPLLLLMMTGIFSFSIALYQKLQLSEAVGNAGRQLAVSRGVPDPCDTATKAIYAAAPGLSPSSMTLSYTIGGTTTKSTTCTSSSALMTAGGNAEIQASYSCFLNVLWMWGKSMKGPCTISSQVTEVVQ
jgi:Flp pilus assembly protein TadG